MPEANQYTFTNREILELLVKHAGVRDGRWVLQATFGFGAGNFGPTPDKMAPGAVTVISHMGIQRAGADTPDEMSVDASTINPEKTVRGRKERASARPRVRG